MRLNDAEEFIEWLLDHIWDEDEWYANRNALDEMIMRKLSALGYIQEKGDKYVRKGRRKEKTKTVDTERHGHWFDEEVEEAGGIYTYTRCSVCGEYALCDAIGQIIETPYCPWCSAKMDEVEE